MPTTPEGRRPLKSRDLPIFKSLAATLARLGVSPNAISFSSIIFGAAAGLALAQTSRTVGWPQHLAWLAAAVFIQLRLIANLLDGMVAVEGRRGGPTGDLWNEAPDRVADSLIFIGAGYGGNSPMLGLCAALMAVFVAYVRALGASVGAGQIFIGPMAKPQRMFVLTILCVAGALFAEELNYASGLYGTSFPHLEELDAGPPIEVMILRRNPNVTTIVLKIIILGCIVTSIRRLLRIAAYLRAKAP